MYALYPLLRQCAVIASGSVFRVSVHCAFRILTDRLTAIEKQFFVCWLWAVGKDLIFAKRGNLFTFFRMIDFGIAFCL